MKTRIYIIPIFLLFVLFTGCNDDFLEKYPTTSIAAGTFWTSESDVEMGLAGCYSKLKGNYLTWTRATLDGMVDNGYCKGYYNANYNTQTGTLDANNCSIQSSLYSAAYAGIAACNVFLANFTKVGLSESVANAYEAEAKFLRAFYYFELVQRWGGVVIYTKVPDNIDDLKIAKSSEEEVYNLIKEDLDFAVTNLPDNTYKSGHAVKTSALALQARIALFRSKWADVITITNSIISSNKYSLATDLRSCFIDQEGQLSCPEIIFSIKYLSTSTGRQTETDGGSENCIFRQSGLVPTKNLIDEYESTDLRLTNWYFYSPDMGTFTRSDGYKFTGCETIHTYYGLIKFAAIWDDKLYGTTSNMTTGHDFVLFRLSEIYLMYAEAMVENGGGSTTDANSLKYVNAIRTRANVTPYTTLTRENIRKERRREMAMEGLRYFDIQRWKSGSEINGKLIFGTNTIKWKDQFYLWPFSQSELDINTNLVQNSGY